MTSLDNLIKADAALVVLREAIRTSLQVADALDEHDIRWLIARQARALAEAPKTGAGGTMYSAQVKRT